MLKFMNRDILLIFLVQIFKIHLIVKIQLHQLKFTIKDFFLNNL